MPRQHAAAVFGDQLLDRDVGVLHDGLHGGHGFEGVVQIHAVEDAEHLLADLVAAASGPAEHLLVKDSASDTAEEDQVADLRDVDAGGEKVNRHGDFRKGVVAI